MSHGTADKKLTRSNTALQNDFTGNAPTTDDAELHSVANRRTAFNKAPPNVTPYLLTVKQTAQRLQLGINCVYNLTKADYNPLPTIVIGRSIRIPVSALERWLETQTHG